jgi:hypothetical protein
MRFSTHEFSKNKKSNICLIFLNLIFTFFFAASLLEAAVIQGAISSKSGSDISAGEFVIQLRKLNPETGVFLFLTSVSVGPETNYTYSFNELEAGVYNLGCQDLSGVFAVQYYGGTPFNQKALKVKLSAVSSVFRANFELADGRAIGGRLVDQLGNPVAGFDISVLAMEKNNQRLYVTGLPTDENGEWLVGLPAGKYIVLFKDLRDSSTPYAAQWYGNSVSEESATTVDLTNSITGNKNINAVLKQGFALRGRVTDGAGNPLKGFWVNSYIVNPITNKLESVLATATGSRLGQTDPSAVGDYSLILGPGEYIIKFSEDTGDFKTQYWNNASSENEAVRIKIEDADISGVDVVMRMPGWSVTPKSADFIGNFEEGRLRGQVYVRAADSGTFTGWVLTESGKSTFRGRLDSTMNATVVLGSSIGSLDLSLKATGLDDGTWDDVDIVHFTGLVKIASMEIPVECRAAPLMGGWPAPLAGSLVNTLLQSRSESGISFGHGFASVKPGKDGVFRFAGALPDGSKLSGTARAVEDGAGGWKLPVAMPLPSVKGFLHGAATINPTPTLDELHISAIAPWTWSRPANAKAKSFAAGFEEELDVFGQVWTWAKGTSVLGGNSANFMLNFTFGNSTGGFVPAVRVDGISGVLGVNNKPVWSSTLPNGFAMKITPTTGLVSGKIPGSRNGKAMTALYQGMLFPSDLPLVSGGFVRGAGFVSSKDSPAGSMIMTLD